MSRPSQTSIAALDGPLSPREREVLRLLAEGLTNLEIAQRLGVARATVRTHIEHIYSKLDVANRVECALEGMRRGLVELPVVAPAATIAKAVG